MARLVIVIVSVVFGLLLAFPLAHVSARKMVGHDTATTTAAAVTAKQVAAGDSAGTGLNDNKGSIFGGIGGIVGLPFLGGTSAGGFAGLGGDVDGDSGGAGGFGAGGASSGGGLGAGGAGHAGGLGGGLGHSGGGLGHSGGGLGRGFGHGRGVGGGGGILP